MNPIKYEKPRGLSEFVKATTPTFEQFQGVIYDQSTGSDPKKAFKKYLEKFKITRPPQSWRYIEEAEEL